MIQKITEVILSNYDEGSINFVKSKNFNKVLSLAMLKEMVCCKAFWP